MIQFVLSTVATDSESRSEEVRRKSCIVNPHVAVLVALNATTPDIFNPRVEK